MSNLEIKITGKTNRLVRLSLSAESTGHSAMFFSHNKSANSTFGHEKDAVSFGTK